MKMKPNTLMSVVAAISLTGFVHANDKHVDGGSTAKEPSVSAVAANSYVSYDVVRYDADGGKGSWNLASKIGLPVSAGMTSVKHGECKFESEPEIEAVNLDVSLAGTTVMLAPVQQYPNGVLTLIDITATSGLPDEEPNVLKWEAGGKQHACIANQGNYSTHRAITTLVLEYGKAAQVKLSDQSIFEITASPSWPEPKEKP